MSPAWLPGGGFSHGSLIPFISGEGNPDQNVGLIRPFYVPILLLLPTNMRWMALCGLTLQPAFHKTVLDAICLCCQPSGKGWGDVRGALAWKSSGKGSGRVPLFPWGLSSRATVSCRIWGPGEEGAPAASHLHPAVHGGGVTGVPGRAGADLHVGDQYGGRRSLLNNQLLFRSRGEGITQSGANPPPPPAGNPQACGHKKNLSGETLKKKTHLSWFLNFSFQNLWRFEPKYPAQPQIPPLAQHLGGWIGPPVVN